MRQSMRKAGMVLLAALVAITIAGLNSVQAARPHASPVVVEYWNNICWQPGQTLIQHMADAFNKSHPGVEVKPRCFSNASVLQPTLLAAIHAGHPPALSQTDAFAVASYVDEGAVQNLAPYIHGKDGWTKAEIDDFFKPVWLNGQYRGGIYSIPFNTGSATVMWYNPKIVKAAGITHLPTTWSEFAADCAKVTTNGNWCMDTTDNEEPLWEAMVLEWGGELVNVTSKGTTAAFDTPAGIGALQFWIPLIKKGYVHKTNSSTKQWFQDYTGGHVAFDANSYGYLPQLQPLVANRFTLSVIPLPAGPVNDDVGNGSDNLFMFKGATPAVKQAAWEYIKFAESPQWDSYWAENATSVPSRKSTVRLMAGYLKTHSIEATAMEELPRAYFSPTVSGWAQAQGDIDTEMSKAMLGQETAAQAIKNAAKIVNHDIATAP